MIVRVVGTKVHPVKIREIPRPRLVLFLLLAFSSFSIVHAQELSAAFIPDLYPLSFIDAEGNRTGFYIDLLNAISDELNYSIRYIEGSWAESFERTVNGEIDLLPSVTYTPERDEFLDFVPEHVLTGWTQVIIPQNSEVESVIDLQGLSVGIMRGDNNGEAFVEFIDSFDIPPPQLQLYDSFPEILSALSANNLDAGVVQSFTEVEQYPGLRRSAIIFNPFHTSFATASGNIPQVLEEMAGLIERWKAGEPSPYYQILNRYFGLTERIVVPVWLTALLIILTLTALFSWLIVRKLTLALRRSKSRLEELNARLEEKIELRSRLLENSQKELVQKEKMAALGNMVAGIAHEVNTPVGVAITASSYLQEQVEKLARNYRNKSLSEGSFHEFIEQAESSSTMIQSNLLRAGDLIQSFKEISVDQAVDEARSINLREYCESVLLSLSPRLKGSRIDYRLQAEDAELEVRPGAIAQILTNLFENAIVHAFGDPEATPDSPLIQITAYTEEIHGTSAPADLNRSLVILVEDNGRGIDAEILPRIYEPFVSSKRFQGSSGLGMSIVHNLVVGQLNGSIRVENVRSESLPIDNALTESLPAKENGGGKQEGRGTRFSIHIPVT